MIPRKANTLTCWQEFSIFTSVEKPFVWRVTWSEPIVGFHPSKTREKGWCDEELFQWISHHLMAKKCSRYQGTRWHFPIKKEWPCKAPELLRFPVGNSLEFKLKSSGLRCFQLVPAGSKQTACLVSDQSRKLLLAALENHRRRRNNPSRCCTTGSFIRTAWYFCINPLRPKVSFKNLSTPVVLSETKAFSHNLKVFSVPVRLTLLCVISFHR